jgi:hypothetical protein
MVAIMSCKLLRKSIIVVVVLLKIYIFLSLHKLEYFNLVVREGALDLSRKQEV